MPEWWFEKNGEPTGPVSEAELIAFCRENSRKPIQLVWSAEMSEWTDARKIPKFAAIFGPPPMPAVAPSPPPPPPLTSSGDTAAQNPVASVELHPWRRFFARSLDMNLWVLAVFAVFLMTGLKVPPAFVVFFMVPILWILVEAAFMAFLGGTPGKLLYGIQVEPRMSYPTAVARSAHVFAQGLWCGLFPLNAIAWFLGYRHLMEKGSTPWDDAQRVVVVHEVMSGNRTVQIGFAWVIVLIASALFPGLILP